MDVSEKTILVIGLGKSGISAAQFLRTNGARVIATDDRPRNEFGADLIDLESTGVSLVFGNTDTDMQTIDWVVVSPGVPLTHPLVQKANEQKIPVLGELELASRFFNGDIIAITGTNGKTTVTTLLGEMCKAAQRPIFVGGNIGTPMIEIGQSDKDTIAVIEVSSFQLDTVDTFHAHVGILLNITGDHQDRYIDFTAYARSKARVFQHQTKEDIAIYNADDTAIEKIVPPLKAQKFPFTWHKEKLSENKNGILLTDASMMIRTDDINDEIKTADIQLKGSHNMENVAAAVLAALSEDIPMATIKEVLQDFKGLPHRMTWVDTIDGISFYDDSKATNTDAVKRALRCFEKPVVLIMGGRDKDSDFKTLTDDIRRHVKKLILTGEAGELIYSVLGDVTDSEVIVDFTEAVQAAYRVAEREDVVLLSPACASFDAFTSYAHRGDVFQNIVKALAKR